MDSLTKVTTSTKQPRIPAEKEAFKDLINIQTIILLEMPMN